MIAKTTKDQAIFPGHLGEPKNIKVSFANFLEISFIEAERSADLIDRANESALLYNEFALETFRLERIAQAAHAYERAQKGMAGICEGCEKPIPSERLEWNPDATRCVKCQEEYEKMGRSRQV